MVFFSLLLFYYDTAVCSYTYESYGLASAYFALFLSVLSLVRNSNRVFLFFIFFFLTLFPFDFLVSNGAEVPLIYVYKLKELPFVFLLFNLFQCSCLFIKGAKVSFSYRNIEFLNSRFVFYFFTLLMLIGTLSLKGSNIFSSSGSYTAYTTNLDSASGLNEYLLILAIFLLFFSKRKTERIIFVLVVGLYVFKSVTYGFRVQSIMALFIIGVAVAKKDPSKVVIWCCAFLGFFIILLFGFLKEGADVSNLGLKILVDDRYGYAQSHQHGVLSSSSTVLDIYSKSTVMQELLDVPATLLSATLPRRFIGDDVPRVYPSAYVQTFEYTPGGVMFLVQIYVLTGWVGFALFNLIFISICNSFNRSVHVNDYKSRVNIVIVVTFFIFFVRWISYDFFNYGVRTLFILTILFSIYKVISKIKN